LHRSIRAETALKPLCPAHEKPLKQRRCIVRAPVQRSMGIVMVTVLAIAVVVELGILIAEIATRARLVARSLSSPRA
jgi:hypothetical protein